MKLVVTMVVDQLGSFEKKLIDFANLRFVHYYFGFVEIPMNDDA